MSRKGKLGLLLMSVVLVALVLSSCFLPQPKTPPTFSVAPTTINAYSGQPFTLTVTGQGGGGITQIVATFQGSTVIKNSNPATFTFVAPQVIAQTQYNLGVTVYGKNGLSSSATETVNVTPYTSVGSITYAVRLNNPYPYVYSYPASNNNQSVIFTVNVGNGAGMVGGVSVYVDGSAIPASPTTLSSVLKATVAGTSFIVQKSFVALYSISLNHVGPHTYWVNFYGTNGSLLGSSASGYFYITYPGAQSVKLSAATPLYNTKYINGLNGVSFTANATDYTSQYEGFLINGTPFATYVNVATAVKVLNAVYPISVPANALTSAGTTTFTFKDVSIDGNAVTANQSYVVVKSAPVLKVTYNGSKPVNNVLYVGINPSYFNVYAFDPYWMTSAATLSSSFGKTPYNLNKNANTPIDVSFLGNSATATFKAYVENYANVVSSTSLTVYRISVGPVIKSAYVYGLNTVNGTPYTTSGTITVAASVVMAFPNLGNVTWELSGVGTPSQFYLTRSSTGLWTGAVNTANLLPGTYKSWIIATDVAQNSATALTSPATVNVYRPLTSPQNVFTTSLTTNPVTPINGFVKSATLTANINPTWIYAIRTVELYREAPNQTTYVSSSTKVGNAGSTYAFTINASGTYKVVTIDNANQRATQVENPYTVKIDKSVPALKFSLSNSKPSTSTKITVKATDLNSGISKLLLEYQTLGSTGANNGAWVPIYATSTNNATYVTFTYTWTNLPPMDGQYNITLVGTSGVGIGGSTSTTFVTNKFVLTSSNVSFIFPPLWTNSTSTVVKIGATVNNESDVTITATSGKAALINFGTPATYTSNSYNIIPFTHTWSATFTGENGTSVAKVKVVDLAGNTVSATQLIGFDNVPPTVKSITAPATVAGNGAKFTVTLVATDNLSAIKSVTVGGVSAVLKTPSSTNEFGVLDGTYVATLTVNQTTSGATPYKIVVVDNAGNTATRTFAVYVDASAPAITVKIGTTVATSVNFVNGQTYYFKTAPKATATVLGYELTTMATYYSSKAGSKPATTLTFKNSGSYTTFEATYSGYKYSITVKATDGVNGLHSQLTTSATVVFGKVSPTVSATLQTRSTPIPYELNGTKMDHYINLASSNTSYNATIVVKDPNSIPIQNAAFYINGTAYPFISNGQFATQPGLTISGSTMNYGGITAATLTLNLNQTPYVSTTGLYTGLYNLTVTATDYALNTNTAGATSFYYDVTKPKLQPNTTLYKSGNYYYFDLGFNKQMATLTNKSIAASIVTFQFANGLTYTSDPASQYFVPVTSGNSGLLHIWGLKTTAGSPVNVLPLAGNTVTITVGASYVSAGGNPVAGPVTVTFTNVSAPKPVNP